MASEVSICSNALLSLGAKPINSFEDNADRALVAANLWPTVRDSVLRAHPWNCATKRVVLSPDVETPAFDYAYQFTLPGDWLRNLTSGEYGYERDYLIESGKLLADENVVRLRYIWRNENPGTWDTLLVETMTKAMAAAMAVPVTADESKKVEFERTLLAALRTARTVNGQENPPATFGDFPLLSVRG